MEIAVLSTKLKKSLFEFLNRKLLLMKLSVESINRCLEFFDFFFLIFYEIVEFLYAILAFGAFAETLIELSLQSIAHLLQFESTAAAAVTPIRAEAIVRYELFQFCVFLTQRFHETCVNHILIIIRSMHAWTITIITRSGQ